MDRRPDSGAAGEAVSVRAAQRGPELQQMVGRARFSGPHTSRRVIAGTDRVVTVSLSGGHNDVRLPGATRGAHRP